MRELVLSIIYQQIDCNVLPAYRIREYALEWLEKKVLLESDVEQIDEMLPKYFADLSTAQSVRQNENNSALASWLASHPVTWSDGELYSVTLEDQQLMFLYYSTYLMGLRDKLEWNSHTKKCREFTKEEFLQLSAKVNNYVEPHVKRCQEYKEQIYSCKTIDDVNSIIIDYSTVITDADGDELEGRKEDL